MQRMSLAHRLAAVFVVVTLAAACASCEDKPSLTCAATCSDYRWRFKDGAREVECASVPPVSSVTFACTASSAEIVAAVNCTSANESLVVCSGVIREPIVGADAGRREWTVRSSQDPGACTMDVSVDGVGDCRAP